MLRVITLILMEGARHGTRFTPEAKIIELLEGDNERAVELRKAKALEAFAKSLGLSPRRRPRD